MFIFFFLFLLKLCRSQYCSSVISAVVVKALAQWLDLGLECGVLSCCADAAVVHRRLKTMRSFLKWAEEQSPWLSSACWMAAYCVCATDRDVCLPSCPRPRWGAWAVGWAGGPSAARGSGSVGRDRTQTSRPSARRRAAGQPTWDTTRPVWGAF